MPMQQALQRAVFVMSSNTAIDVEDSAAMADDFKFHDSGQDDVLFDKGKVQTHTFSDFPNTAESDEEEDKSQLLKDEKKAPSFWTFEYYQQFFDVETSQVLHRIAGSMLPMPSRNYLQIHVRPTPDLYGPFWICTTLVFTTAIAGNLANYLSSAGADYQWKYDFHKVTFAATAIFSYWWLVPMAIYGVLWWRQSQAGYTFLEMICVYGYSLAIYIPISILWVINITWFKWILVSVGAVLSGGVLVITFWPAVKNDTKQVAVTLMAVIFIFHAALAAGFVLYFFYVPPSAMATTTTTTASPALSTLKPLDPENLAVRAPAMNAAQDQPADTAQSVLTPDKVSANEPAAADKSEQNLPQPDNPPPVPVPDQKTPPEKSQQPPGTNPNKRSPLKKSKVQKKPTNKKATK